MTHQIAGELLWSSPQRSQLGESPLWDPADGSLYWIDVIAPAVHRWAAGTTRAYPCPKPVASLFLGRTGRLWVAMRNGLSELNLDDGHLAPVAGVTPPSDEERFNDGRCDATGRLWISTMDRRLERGIGSIVRVETNWQTASLPTGAKLGNGLCFSPDGRCLYFADTFARTLYRYDMKDGAMPTGGTLFAELDAAPGRPDGCSVDAEGCLWSARVGGGRIDRYAPDGRLIGVLPLPVSHPTHCTFGGPNLSILYITSSRHRPDSAAFDAQPLAGAVLAFGCGVRGLPEPRFEPTAWSTPGIPND